MHINQNLFSCRDALPLLTTITTLSCVFLFPASCIVGVIWEPVGSGLKICNVGKAMKENINDNATFEDQESFQDQEKIHHYHHCNETLLRIVGEENCLSYFDWHMLELGENNWCNWEMVLSYYHFLTQCLESYAGQVRCYYPNAVVQETFVDVHRQYFSSCGTKEEALQDAPARVVLVLTLLPVSVIPVLVYMVIWKSSVID